VIQCGCAQTKCVLHVQYKDIILQGLRLTDKHINATQKLLKRQLIFIQGLHTTLKVTIESHSAWIHDSLQIFHTRRDHWITLTTLECHENKILIFDSLYDDFDTATKTAVKIIFPACYQIPLLPKQKGPMDCGLYAIAYATHLAYGRDPHKLTTRALHFNHELTRRHLVKHIEQGHLTEFP